MRLGIFGGTFNPVHYGHLRAAEEVSSRMSLDRVLFIPTGTPPLKSDDLADATDRFAMTSRAIAGNPAFAVSDVELHARGKSFTVDTVARLKQTHPQDHLFLMLGIDAFLDMPNWYRPDDLITMIDFIVMTRPGYKPDALNCSPFILLTAPALTNCRQLTSGKTATCISITPHDISSTDIRQRVRNGQNISHLVPDSVASYISQKLLYRS